jgi:fibro-slime domain-containing protein
MQKLLIFILFITLVYSQQVPFTVQIRDFNITAGCNCDTYRTEFEGPINDDRKMVKFDLGPDRLPVYAYGEKERSAGGTVSGRYTFDSFWKGGEDCIVTDIFLNLSFTKNGNKLSYSNNNFFPIDNMGYGNYGTYGHNFHFTMQMHTSFTYQGGEDFQFSGDDDVWVFINNKLALDLGGVHGTETATFKLDDLKTTHGITVGGTYNFDFFFCERHVTGSNLIITTSIIVNPPNPPCQTDADSDGVPDCRDNCINTPNPDQRDCNFNGKGDVCDTEASRIEFPFESHFYYHYNAAISTTDPYVFGQSTQFDNLASTSPMVISFNDFIPKDVIPNYNLEALVSVRNKGQVNCPITLQFKSGTSLQSSSLFFLSTPGDSFAIRNYALMNSFYTFANKPLGAGSEVTFGAPGANTFTITSTSAACNTNLSIGSVVISTRFTLPTNNVTNYYSKCTTNNDCQFGTKRFGGYCACWSGAFGLSCTMDTGTPGAETDPVTSTVDDAWSSTVPQITDPGVYVGLDLALMATKAFYRNFSKHPTCPNLANWQNV